MILVDTFEPTELENLLKQIADVIKTPLNQNNQADYVFRAIDGHLIQIERKQCGELLGNLNHAEKQLMKYLPNADETLLLVEGGAFAPAETGTLVFNIKGRQCYADGVYQGVKYAQLIAWFYQIDKCGVTVYQTGGLEASAVAIGAIYSNSQKEEHTTLRRYIKEKITPLVPDPYVATLMGLQGVDLGEVRAKALIKHFETPFFVFMASEEELCEVPGIGYGIARKIHEALGRK